MIYFQFLDSEDELTPKPPKKPAAKPNRLFSFTLDDEYQMLLACRSAIEFFQTFGKATNPNS